MWIEDPDGIRIVLVEVPADHPLRRGYASGFTSKVTTGMRQIRMFARRAPMHKNTAWPTGLRGP
jgi:hypothetical protein